MLMFALFALVLGVAAALVYRSNPNDNIYKITSGVLLCGTLYFCYLFLFYYQVGLDVRSFYNNGRGTVFVQTLGNTTVSHTFYDSSDIRVGEYLALRQGDYGFISVVSPLLPIFIGIIILWMIYDVSQKYFFGVKK